MISKTLVRLLVLLASIAAFAAVAGPAAAAPGAYRVLVVYNSAGPPEELQAQIAAEPGVATVGLFNTDDGPEDPSFAQLFTYDLVVDVPNSSYSNEDGYGNVLAAYLDAGGVLVQFAYDNWDEGSGELNGPAGRFASGGYAPFIPGPNKNQALTLGSFDAAAPLMQNVGALTSTDNTEPGLAPGATLVAEWTNGVKAIAYKGNVVSVSAYAGGEEISGSGNYGRLAVNAVRWLGRQTLTVSNLNPAGGTVTGSGLNCGPTCSAIFNRNTAVGLVAAANPGFAFAGFGNACAGTACNLTMDASKTVSANFYAFGTAKKVKKNKKKGTALLSFGVGGPGVAVLSGKKVKKRSKAATAAKRIKLPVVAKGKAVKTLQASGKVKVKVKVAFTPTGGATASFTKKVTLKLLPAD